MDEQAIVADYEHRRPDCERFLREITHQVGHLIDESGVSLGAPVEGRVKTLASLLEKVERKERTIASATDFPDLVGVRITLLFHRDLEVIDDVLATHFEVIERADTADRLEASQFGYQSLHFILKVRPEWASLPSFRRLSDYVFEVQLRTLAQHIWAVASHKLQYKREASVPLPLRRSISRASALLEMVDLEFDRVLNEREKYVTEPNTEDALLNVDLLAATLDAIFPAKNKDAEREKYDEMLKELGDKNIIKVADLKKLVSETWPKVKAEEEIRVAKALALFESMPMSDEVRSRRLARNADGVFFTHTGLLRNAMKVKWPIKKESSKAIVRRPVSPKSD
ncbi:GTP pyrophosphokinase family protein [Xanthomonas sp. NCPPB 2632]|uniref:GTP pyrophosphokinase n=1 Tax=Xanthomonas sp. NCPPB 2632 TaxID=3240912 RepID=UPI0035157DE2